MPLDGYGYEAYETPDLILGHLNPDSVPIDLTDSYLGLQYLNRLTQQTLDTEDVDIKSFRQELYDLSFYLREEVLTGIAPEEMAWKTEKLEESITALFNSLPSALSTQALQPIMEAQETDIEVTQSIETSSESPAASEQIRIPANLIPKFNLKEKLSTKGVINALAFCAALSLPSDEIQLPKGPEHLDQVHALVQATSAQTTAQINLPNIQSSEINTQVPIKPKPPETEQIFQLLESGQYPVDLVAKQAPGMLQRINFVLQNPERRAIFDQLQHSAQIPAYMSVIGIIESNLNPEAVSGSGAIGVFQDMAETQGAFGDTATLSRLIKQANSLLPKIDHAAYQRAIKAGGENLKHFLRRHRLANTPFWQEFKPLQRDLLKNTHQAQLISYYYLESLQQQAVDKLDAGDNSVEALYFGVMAYNVGMGNVRLLRRIMRRQNLTSFTPDSALEFIKSKEFEDVMRAEKRSNLINDFKEAQTYLARFIAGREILHHNGFRV